jgi:hypothetical protein
MCLDTNIYNYKNKKRGFAQHYCSRGSLVFEPDSSFFPLGHALVRFLGPIFVSDSYFALWAMRESVFWVLFLYQIALFSLWAMPESVFGPYFCSR